VGEEENRAQRLRTEFEAMHADLDMPSDEKLAAAMRSGDTAPIPVEDLLTDDDLEVEREERSELTDDE
jgi:hypothetical protein